MTKPKPFPWREPLRYTLECRQQGGNWWIAAGEVTLNDEWEDIVWDETPWAFNIRVSCGFVLVSETKIPKTGKSVSKNRINWMKTQSGVRGASRETCNLFCNYFRENKKLPYPSELKKYILHHCQHNKLIDILNSEDGFSYLRNCLGFELYFMLPRKRTEYIEIKPPYSWKNSIIRAITRRLGKQEKGKFILKLETNGIWKFPLKRLRGRPKKQELSLRGNTQNIKPYWMEIREQANKYVELAKQLREIGISEKRWTEQADKKNKLIQQVEEWEFGMDKEMWLEWADKYDQLAQKLWKKYLFWKQISNDIQEGK